MRANIDLLVIIIAIITVVSGLAQVIAPAFVLGFIGASITPATMHFFGIVGMFMALFGGMMLHAIFSANPNHVAILWAAFQKLGAFIAVGLGVLHGIFSLLALSVALFDLFSGLLFLYYLKSLRTREIH